MQNSFSMKILSHYFVKEFSIPISEIKGIGPAKEKALNNEGFFSVGDLIYYKPRKYVNRSKLDNIETFENNKFVQVIGKVFSVSEIGKGKKRLSVVLESGGILINLIFFRFTKWFKNFFDTDDDLFVTGKIQDFRGNWQIVHPEIEKIESDSKILSAGIVPFYRMTEAMKKAGFDSRVLRKIIYQAFQIIPNKLEFYPANLKKDIAYQDLYKALLEIHFPTTRGAYFKALHRLKVDEILPLLFLLEFRKKREVNKVSLALNFSLADIEKVKSFLPFNLTNGQHNVLSDVINDIKSKKASYRLIQGDVGSGKTAVAFVLMVLFAAYGYQTVLMAPTEVLAKQHYQNFKELLFGTNFPVYQITGSTKKSEKDKVAKILASGDAAILIGTHALIEDYIKMPELGLVIIDEQHRFGVEQRRRLIEKGSKDFVPHTIFMTATPIPRTITQTLYGDMDVSVIDTLPKGRKPVKTYLLDNSRLNDLYAFLKKEILAGRQIYFIYPLVEGSEKIKLKNAVEEFEYLNNEVFSDFSVALLHGKMKSSEKEQVLVDFKAKKYDVLVSTTVVEVGVDVPNATVMVVENSERFGLAQLHQLRGRVGRGEYQSYCFLVPSAQCNEDSLERLSIMPKTNSGFEISQFDLQIRGPGEFTGIKQSGVTEFRFVNLLKDEKIFKELRKKISLYIEENDRKDDFFLGEIKEFLQLAYSDTVLNLNA